MIECFAQNQDGYLYKVFYGENKICTVEICNPNGHSSEFVYKSKEKIEDCLLKYKIIPEDLLNQLFVDIEIDHHLMNEPI
jgi:hypothetical protein